jgi:glycosyltransferase involved in cell wall biosynthesis
MRNARQTPAGAVFVLGMHRSGTSALTRGLQVLGLELGDNLKGPVAADNEKGFFENWALSEINDELLGLNGGAWDSLFAESSGGDHSDRVNDLKLRAIEIIDTHFRGAPYFAFKDPRSCRTLPFWKDVLSKQQIKAHYVIAFRNPLSVAKSLESRNGFTRARAYYLWQLHTLNAVRNTRDEARVFIDYDDVIRDPKAMLTRVASLIDDPRVAVSEDAFREYAIEFLDSKLRHHSQLASHLELDNACPPAVRDVFGLLRAETAGVPGGERADLNAEWERCFKAFDEVAQYSGLLDSLDRQSRQAASERDVARVERDAMLGERDAMLGEQAALQNAHEGLRQRHAAQERDIETLRRAHDALIQEVAYLERQLQQRAAQELEIEALRRAHDALIEEVADFERQLQQREAQQLEIDALRRAHDTLIQEVADLQRQLQQRAEAERDQSELEVVNAARETAERDHEHRLQLKALGRKNDALDQRLRDILSSSSWRITKPLRMIKRGLSGAGGEVTSAEIEALPSYIPGRRIHFTICAKNYLPIARTCLESSRRAHSHAEHVLVLCDEVDQGYDPSVEAFSVVPIRQVAVPGFQDMALRYDVMELNTAVKPFCFAHFFASGADEVIYLDPDLYFLKPMAAIDAAFSEGEEAVLTPHITAPIEDDKYPGDLDLLRSGSYNLGFLALRNTVATRRFVAWWGEHLRTGAVFDLARGLFTDQKWCELLPSLVERTKVLRHPGYNLAYWNLMHRPVALEDGLWTAGGAPICFVHFSGASFSDERVFSKHQDRYDAGTIGALRKLYDTYRDEVRARGLDGPSQYVYSFNSDPLGRPIPYILRQIYREEMSSAPNVAPPTWERLAAFANETTTEAPQLAGRRVTRVMHRVWMSRPDLQKAFDLRSEEGQDAFLDWCQHSLQREYGIDQSFLSAAATHAGSAAAQTAAGEPSLPLMSLSRAVLTGYSHLRPLYRHVPARLRERVKTALIRRAYPINDPAKSQVRRPTRPGVALVGYARGELGMGEHIRMTAAALGSQGAPMGIVNVSENLLARQEDRRLDHLFDDDANFRANIFHINADQLPIVCAKLGQPFMAGRTNIAYPFWELGNFPPDWAPSLDVMDEVWAPSRFIAETLAKSIDSPIVHMSMAVELAPGYEKWRRSDFGLPSDAMVFLFYFDLASYPSRKNPKAVIDAFKAAFGAERPVRQPAPILLVKVISADQHPTEFRALQDLVANVPGVILIPDIFSTDQVHGLVNCVDAFVSLHRSEGFGRGPAEAMRLGKVAIATGYSGNMDYMNETNSFPVKYRMRAVGAKEYPFGAGQYWADPDIAETAAIMRRLADDPSLAREVGGRAREYMNTHHAQEVVGARYIERLRTIGAL